jgi:hypothetical protein
MSEFNSSSGTSSLNHTYYSAITDLHNSPLHTHHNSAPSLVVFWQRISTQKLGLQITIKSSCHFLFNHPGTSELSWNSPGLKSNSKSHCDWRSVSQSVLVSSAIWCSWPNIYYCLTVTVLSLWGTLSPFPYFLISSRHGPHRKHVSHVLM